MDSKTAESRAHYAPRLEDDPLVRGLGRFAADVPLTGQAIAYFVRSPHAFADIRSIDTAAAKAVPGVLAVLTGADMDEAKIGNISQHPPVAGRGGTKLVLPFRPALAGKTVRHIGEAVAVVIGETLTAAQDGAETGRGRIRGAHAGRSTCATRSSPATRRSGPRLPATSRSIGPAWRPTRTPTPRRSIASSPRPSTSRASRCCISASSSPRWSRAAPPRATIPPKRAISCAAARRARERCATASRRSWACPIRSCASPPRTSAARSG